MLATDTCEFFNILGGFFLENFKRIVVGDDTEEMMEFIDDRKNNEVVFGQRACGFFLVGGGENEFIRILHDVADGSVPGFKSEVSQTNFSDEPALFIDSRSLVRFGVPPFRIEVMTSIDGVEFDATEDGKTALLRVNQVIMGWREALKQMPTGAKWEIVIPPSLAYGERGVGTTIGPNETLVFEVELVAIKP